MVTVYGKLSQSSAQIFLIGQQAMYLPLIVMFILVPSHTTEKVLCKP